MTVIVPQRFQIVNSLSPLEAAYRLLALTLCGPIAAAAGGSIIQRLKVPPFYILLLASVFQILALGLATTVSTIPGEAYTGLYGFEVLMGLGFGLSISTVVMMIPLIFKESDMAVGMGAVNQFRYLGGSVCLAVCTNVLNNRFTQKLETIFSPSQLVDLAHSAQAIDKISDMDLQLEVRSVYGEGYELQLYVVLAFSGASLLATLMIWEKNLRRF